MLLGHVLCFQTINPSSFQTLSLLTYSIVIFHRWTLTRFGLKAPGRPALTKEWHLTPSWLVGSSMQYAPSIRMTTARQEVTLWCTPTTPTVVRRNPSTSLFPTLISTFPLWTTIRETTSSTCGTIITCYATSWNLDRRIQPQVSRGLKEWYADDAIFFWISVQWVVFYPRNCIFVGSWLTGSVRPAGSSRCPVSLIAFCAWCEFVPQVMQREQLVL